MYLLFFGYIAGFFGIALGLFVYTCVLCNLKSFGVSYAAPYAPVTGDLDKNGFFLEPTWQREKRADFLDVKKQKRQNHISMKWRYK